MLELFNEYKNSDKIAETLLVGKNMVNRYPQDERMFDAYFAYLCGFAERLPALGDRQHFAQLAEVTLAFYEENASLSTDVVSKISQYHKQLNSIFSAISEAQSESIKKESYVLQSRNKEKLKELLSLKDSLRKAKSQQTFDKIEVLLDDVPIQFVPAKSLIATTQTYSYINASLVFATCNGDPIFWDKGKIYTCAHGVKNPNWEYISPSFDDFLTSLY